MAILADSKSKILVTGSRGYIGSHLGSMLSHISIDRQNAGPEHLKELKSFDPKAPEFSEVESVVHLADRRLQDLNQANIDQNIEEHRLFLGKLGDLPRFKRLIWASSCSVYGYSEDEIHEISVVNPTSFYAESKLAVEGVIQDLSLPSLILRFGTAHGWSPAMRTDLFVNQVAQAAKAKEELEIYSPEAWRPYVHCRDFARKIQLSLSSDEIGIRNVVTENFRKSQIMSLPSLREQGLRYRVVPENDPRNYKVRPLGSPSDFIGMNESIVEMMSRFTNAKD